MAVESACIAVPSEIIMPFSGYLGSTGRFDLPLVRDRRRDRLQYALNPCLCGRLGGAACWRPRRAPAGQSRRSRSGRPVLSQRSRPPVHGRLLPLSAPSSRFRGTGAPSAASFPGLHLCRLLAVVLRPRPMSATRLGERWSSDPTLRTWLHGFRRRYHAAAACSGWHGSSGIAGGRPPMRESTRRATRTGRPALLAVAALIKRLLAGVFDQLRPGRPGPPSPCAGPPALDAEPAARPWSRSGRWRVSG